MKFKNGHEVRFDREEVEQGELGWTLHKFYRESVGLVAISEAEHIDSRREEEHFGSVNPDSRPQNSPRGDRTGGSDSGSRLTGRPRR